MADKGRCAESDKARFLKHGIQGMLKCLNCMHVIWNDFQVVLQGAFTGKGEMLMLVLEARLIITCGSGMQLLDLLAH